MEHVECDVFILGAGLSGSTLALQIKNQNKDAKIVLSDKKNLPMNPGDGAVGESTVEVASHYFANILGLKEHLQKDHLEKFGLRFFFPTQNNTAIENRLEMGLSGFSITPSYQIDRALLESHIWTKLKNSGVSCLPETQLLDLKLDHTDHRVELRFRDNQIKKYKAKWFIDATGRTSYLKKKLNLKEKIDLNRSASWWKISETIKIDEWSDCKNWTSRDDKMSRWLSTNHLLGKGYWFWLIPLSSGQTSFGLVVDNETHPFAGHNTLEKALTWLDKFEPEAAKICRKNQSKIKDFGTLNNYTHGCKEVFSSSNWAITGEAGVFIDPFYSPGSDFIAFSNTYITDLVTRSLNGEETNQRAKIYNDIYLQLFKSSINTFKNKYSILGNPSVMPLKVFWDWCFYWLFFGNLFFNNSLCNLNLFSKAKDSFDFLDKLNMEMQSHFSNLNKKPWLESNVGFLNITNHTFLTKINANLTANCNKDLSDQERIDLLKTGTKVLEKIALAIKGIEIKNKDSSCEISLAINNYYEDLSNYINAA